jgi:hypothetical protein
MRVRALAALAAAAVLSPAAASAADPKVDVALTTARLRTASAIAIALAAAFAAAPGSAEPVPVDLQLVIAVDISQSMDPTEQRIQRSGYVEAFRSLAMVEAIAAGPYGKIAVTYVEWSSANYQRVIAPWQVIATKDDADAFAWHLDAAPIIPQSWTAISSALRFAANQFQTSPAVGERRTIDVSGDGHNNDGPPVADTRDLLVEEGIIINGLPIMIRPLTARSAAVPLDVYYKECVIGGAGSFMVVATSATTFKEAIRRKLILEIAAAAEPLPPALHVSQPAREPSVDCLVGEHSIGPGATPLGDR